MTGILGMDSLHQLVRKSGNDGEGLEPVPLRVLPCVPEAGEGDGLAVDEFEAVGRLQGL